MLKKTMISLLICSSALAECPIPTKVKAGEASPCAGYVMDDATELKIRTDLIYKNLLIDNLRAISAAQENIIKIDKQQLEIYESQAKMTDLNKTLYFGLGALVTGLVAYGTVRALR